MSEIIIDGLKLTMTCSACPEQYDVANGRGQPCGYLRLRHGVFRADFPECGGKTVYEAYPKGEGEFEDDEREYYLTLAVAALKKAQRDASK